MLTAQVWSICDQFQTALVPWHAAGYSVASIGDIDTFGNFPHIKCRVEDIESLPGALFVLAWPPCTHLARSGARYWKTKGDKPFIAAMATVKSCIRLIGSSPGLIENPVGRLSTHWRKPDLITSPCRFTGQAQEPAKENYTKKTCLWLLNGARAPVPSVAEGIGSPDNKRIVNMNAAKRSQMDGIKTPSGLAKAVYLANQRLVQALVGHR